MLITLVGPDGAGKSTLSNKVARTLSDAGVKCERVDRWDIVGDDRYPSGRVLLPDVATIRTLVAGMPCGARLKFLFWCMELALTGRVPAHTEPTLLLDSYWMKHAAVEVVYGLPENDVLALASTLPSSDLTVYLRVSPAAALARKVGSLVPYECGMDPDCAENAFISHQTALLNVLDCWAVRFGWVSIDAEQPLEIVTRQVLTTVTAAIADNRGGRR